MATQQKLEVIDQGTIGKRTTVFYNGGRPMVLLRGTDGGASDLCCGNCGAVLVQAIFRHRFIAPSVAEATGAKVMTLSPGGAGGPIVISGTLPLPNATLSIEAAVLNCPTCRSNNETLPASQ